MADPAPSIPDTFDEARSSLAPRLQGVVPNSISTLGLTLDAQQSAAMATAVQVQDIAVGTVLETDAADVHISRGVLAGWGVELRDALSASLDNTLGRDFSDVSRVGEGTFLIEDARFAASAVLRPDLVSQLPLKGQPVILTPASDVMVVTGADDVDGLQTATELTVQVVDRGERLVSITPLVERGGVWTLFEWPSAANGDGVMSALSSRWSSVMYARQAPLLAELYGREGRDVHVASAELARTPSGTFVTYTTLTEGVATALPATDEIVLMPTGAAPVKASWSQAAAFLENDLRAADGILPARFVTNHFPTSTQLAQLAG